MAQPVVLKTVEVQVVQHTAQNDKGETFQYEKFYIPTSFGIAVELQVKEKNDKKILIADGILPKKADALPF